MAARAAVHPAEILVRTSTTEVEAILKADNKPGNEKQVIDKVQATALTNFDFTRLTARAVGRPWLAATSAQKQALTDEFKTLLIRTYSSALTSFKLQRIDVKPLLDNSASGEVTVNTEVFPQGGSPLKIDYRLASSGNTWKVVDVIVAGVSIVTTNRNSFNQTISNSGIDGLIKQLVDRNAYLAKSGK